MKRLIVASIIVLSAFTSLAQEKTSESIEVRVVNVDVVVHDRAGKPVTGLTRDDFEIFENGQKREITNLYEVRAATAKGTLSKTTTPAEPSAAQEPAAEVRPRNILMFVDNYSLQPFRRDKVLQSLRKFIDEKLIPQDRVMLVLCTQQVKVVTPFTNDRKAIQDGIESIKKMVSASQNRTSALEQVKSRINQFIDTAKEPRSKLTFTEAYSLSTTMVEALIQDEIISSRFTLSALGQMTATLSGLEGKNVIIFAGAHLPEYPGRETYMWLYNSFSPYISSLSIPSEGLSGTAGSLQRYSIEEAAKQASANNIALYIIDAADTRDSISAESNSAADKTEQFTSFTNTAMAYQTLARISGGMALTNSDNFDSAFETLANDLNSYYSLGFKPTASVTGKARNVVIKMKNPEYRFRARETYLPNAPSTEDEMSRRVTANLYNADPHNTWQVDLRAGKPEKDGDQYKVPFELSFTPTITLVPQDDNLLGNFTVYVVVGSDGRTSKVLKNSHPVKVPVDAEDDFRTKPMTYKAVILMTPGENTLSVGIVDQNSNNSGFAHVKVVVPK